MATKQLKTAKIQIDYDAKADVLYISFGKPRPGIAVELEDGNLVRVEPYNDAIVGITIIDFRERYMKPKARSIEKYAKRLIPKILGEFKNTLH